VLAVRPETARATTFALALERRTPHRAGQYVVLRLTAEDGYTAQRAYSIASPPEHPDGSDTLELTVELLPGGEVSEFLHEVVAPGDELEVRGPIGPFSWPGDGPALLVGGGSGVVPLMAMLRLARRTGRADLLRVLVSARTPEELIYADELPGPGVHVVFSRAAGPAAPGAPGRAAGRITAADVAPLVRGGEAVYVCGSSGFADAATALLQGAGVAAGAIRVERFGPTGTVVTADA
jgi:ferredoxin-NADP reductase